MRTCLTRPPAGTIWPMCQLPEGRRFHHLVVNDRRDDQVKSVANMDAFWTLIDSRVDFHFPSVVHGQSCSRDWTLCHFVGKFALAISIISKNIPSSLPWSRTNHPQPINRLLAHFRLNPLIMFRVFSAILLDEVFISLITAAGWVYK